MTVNITTARETPRTMVFVCLDTVDLLFRDTNRPVRTLIIYLWMPPANPKNLEILTIKKLRIRTTSRVRRGGRDLGLLAWRGRPRPRFATVRNCHPERSRGIWVCVSFPITRLQITRFPDSIASCRIIGLPSTWKCPTEKSRRKLMAVKNSNRLEERAAGNPGPVLARVPERVLGPNRRTPLNLDWLEDVRV